jgi:hypothetical protein
MYAGWVGFGLSTENTPLSPIEEKNFVFELVSGTGEAFAETAEAAYAGLIEQKKNPPPPKENPVKRGGEAPAPEAPKPAPEAPKPPQDTLKAAPAPSMPAADTVKVPPK